MEFKNDYVLGFSICEIFTVITLQDWVDWGIFTVILGYPRKASGDIQHLEARSELQDWLRFEFFTVKNYRTGPFSKYLGNNFELYSVIESRRTAFSRQFREFGKFWSSYSSTIGWPLLTIG